MDFFASQDRARRSTSVQKLYFSLAVAATILLVYLIPVFVWHAWKAAPATTGAAPALVWWYPDLFGGVCAGTLIVVLGGAAVKIAELRRGGGAGVARMLGGREILPDTNDFFERRLRNVVEEMAIASGVPVPSVFVMEKEAGINAFAAGFGVSDAVVAVTHGTLTGLSRDELQGVVAHEFSHVLNRDMALNINLMGLLHGLLIIGLTGRVLLRFAGDIGRSRDGSKLALPVVAGALALVCAGFTGFFFCKLIKASISRQRERLADASAVQFTRNPAGLAEALKKIGGLAEGARIRSPRAEQASHMFFGNGARAGLFNTHPPLRQRIQWLEPTFDGNFPTVTYHDLREQLARFEGAPKQEKKKADFVDLFTNPVKVATAAVVVDSIGRSSQRPPSPHMILESIGRPMERHAERARELIASIPAAVRARANNPYGARGLVYFLLLDPDAEVRGKQMVLLKEMAEPEVYQTIEAATANIGAIAPEQRLPIIDLTIPALRFLSESQYRAFLQVVNALIDADGRVDVFEYALKRVLTHHLDPVFDGESKRRPANYYGIRGLTRETSILLSVLAGKGHARDTDAATAFLAAVETINDPKAEFQMLGAEQCTWDQLDAALDKLNEASAQLKKLILAAALTCLMSDREITVEEVELFRTIAVTLDCPVPPWVTPARLS